VFLYTDPLPLAFIDNVLETEFLLIRRAAKSTITLPLSMCTDVSLPPSSSLPEATRYSKFSHADNCFVLQFCNDTKLSLVAAQELSMEFYSIEKCFYDSCYKKLDQMKKLDIVVPVSHQPVQSELFYFYQIFTGQYLFPSLLDVRILKAEFKNYDLQPISFKAPIIALNPMILTTVFLTYTGT
jgi:hypothetical protein